MFLTNEKKKHSTWQGTFYTRKWNGQTRIVYFEKLYGGRPLLKKVNQLALQENLIFNSSMVDENNSAVWQSAGWKVLEKLNNPEEQLDNVINIIGSDGKNSVLTSLKYFLEANRQKVNGFTSPHLYNVQHRFWLGNRFISINEIKKYK